MQQTAVTVGAKRKELTGRLDGALLDFAATRSPEARVTLCPCCPLASIDTGSVSLVLSLGASSSRL